MGRSIRSIRTERSNHRGLSTGMAGGGGIPPSPLVPNKYITENSADDYVTEDGASYYIQEN